MPANPIRWLAREHCFSTLCSPARGSAVEKTSELLQEGADGGLQARVGTQHGCVSPPRHPSSAAQLPPAHGLKRCLTRCETQTHFLTVTGMCRKNRGAQHVLML